MKKKKLTITFSSALHHGSGYGLSGLVDRAFLRDAAGIPYLAGSAVKGRFRHAVLRLVLAEEKDACQYGDQPGLCPADEPCVVCGLFGSPRTQGRLYFSDAYPRTDFKAFFSALENVRRAHPFDPRDATIRATTAMNRVLGTARHELLFSTETLPAGLVFESAIRGEWDEAEEGVLQNASHLLTHFGADASRGLGRCEYKLS